MAALLLMLLFVLSAHGRDCVAGEAPTGYVAGTCGGSFALPDLCTEVEDALAIHIECRADDNGGTGAADIYLETKGFGEIEIWLTPQDDDLESTQYANTGAFTSPYVEIHGGPGADTMHGPIDPDTPYMEIHGDQGDDTLYSYDAASCSYGGADDDTLHGDGDGNQLHGDDAALDYTGHDTIYGGGGGDAIYPGRGDDVVYAGSGSDMVQAYWGADEVYGEEGDDWLVGGAHADSLVGGDGDDLVQGEGGDDIIQGNAGADDLYGDSGGDTLCAGTTPTKDFDNMHGGDGDDALWATSGPANPSGSDTGGSNTCGHSLHGAFLVSGSCSYSLTVAPAGCS